MAFCLVYRRIVSLSGLRGEARLIRSHADNTMPPRLEELVKVPTILLVDDDADFIAGLSDRLIAEGFYVMTTHSGLEALSCLQISRPSVILLDFHMPEMDGIETLQAIHRVDPKIPVIMMTGADHQELQRHRVLCEAAEYVSKPVDWRLLRQTLISVLGQWPAGEAQAEAPRFPHPS